MRQESEGCIYCGAIAARWCDFVIGFTDPDGDGLFSTADGSELVRCDAPLCDQHSAFQYNFHVSGQRGWNESVDFCHGHDPLEDCFAPITTEEAERVRYRNRCLARPLRLATQGAPK